MAKNLTPIARALALCGLSAFLLGSGCSGGPARSPAVPAKPEVLLRIVEEMYDSGGWTIAGEILVTRDGHYRQTFGHPSQSSDTIEGRLPLSLTNSLEQEVVREKEFELVKGVPTYRYGIDDHHIRHPNAIKRLLAFVAAEEANPSNPPSE